MSPYNLWKFNDSEYCVAESLYDSVCPSLPKRQRKRFYERVSSMSCGKGVVHSTELAEKSKPQRATAS
jgi:hypothetical protein